MIRPTLTKFLLKIFSYGRCLLLLPEFLGLFLPRCPFGWKLRPALFNSKVGCSGGGEGILVTIVSSECGWGNFDDCLGEEGEEVSFMKSFFEILYVLFFSWRFSFFPEATLKRLPTATEAEVKQVISAQLKYAPDRAHGGGRGNDGRVTQRSWNGSGTANPQLWEICYCIYLGLSDKTTYNFFMERSFHSSHMIHVEKMRINWVISFFVICCFSTNICVRSRKKRRKIATPDFKKYTPPSVENKIVGCVSFNLF